MTEHPATPGIAEAEALYGAPEVWEYDLDDCGDRERFWEMWQKRLGEVVLVLRRPDGRLILETKGFYPAGAYRLPTGGIRPGEDLLAAVQREMREETGLAAPIVRFLGILRYHFRRHGEPLERASYVFLLAAGNGEPRPEDEAEEITGFRAVPAEALEAVAEHLAALPGEWAVWGRFRALAHWFVAGALGRQAGCQEREDIKRET